MIKLVIFDFDGTLVDTVTDVVDCFNQALTENGYDTYTVKEFHQFVGGNLETIVSSMLPEERRTNSEVNKVKERYRAIYLNSNKPNSLPYKGIEQVLKALEKQTISISVNSNKGQLLLEDMVSKCFPNYSFSGVIGYKEELPSKPNPFGAVKLMEMCNCSKQETIYIGDGKSDIETAANAGIPCILASWGQTQERDLSDKRVAYIAKEPLDILKFLNIKDN